MTAITPGNTSPIPMRSLTSTASMMTDQMLKEIKDNPEKYSNKDDNGPLKTFLTNTCKASMGHQKTLTAVYKEMEAYLNKKDQRNPTVINVQQALTDLLKTFQRAT